MKNLNDEKLDRITKEAIHSELENSPVPPMSSEESWQQIHHRLSKQRSGSTKSRYFKNKFVFAAAAIFLIASLVFALPQSGVAYSKLTEVFHNIQGSVVQLFTKVGDKGPASERPPSSDEYVIIEDSEMITKQLNLEEARQETAFTITLPKFVPEEFVLESVTVMMIKGELSDDILLHYEGDQRKFTINQKQVGDSFSSGVTVDNDDTQVESIVINDYQAQLLLFKNDVSELFWVTQSFYFSIRGELAKEEIVEIANSL
ncbi:DUF4367 domain-containing protein [Virgibacillus byunsanensis]|uniref:DUF4367 domain-containing protein n=1 Tax=Virgibacillus byunsanensis TaxID=570945 RepID=A0ABW3LRV3_9BACI